MDIKKVIKEKRIQSTYRNENRTFTAVTLDRVSVPSRDEMATAKRKAGATDYAIANYIAIKDGKASYWLRGGASTHDCDAISNDGTMAERAANLKNTGLRPRIFLDAQEVIQEQKNSLAFNIISEVMSNGMFRHFIEFGEYPQSLVDNELGEHLEGLFRNLIKAEEEGFEKTGNSYRTGHENFRATEYTFAGEKYVRAKVHLYGGTKKFAVKNGELKDGQIMWFKVEPIKWEILNWSELPKEISPHGNGTASEIELFSEDVLTGNIPFYNATMEEYYGKNKNYGQWKYSTIRGYLNGIDVNNVLVSMDGYDREEYSGGDFNGKGFFDEAFSEIVKEHKIEEARKKKGKQVEKKTYAFGVKIEDTPISVKEQMKFYIEHGKSFMLHGPSGVGKTRRVQEIDPDCVMLQLRNGILPEEIIGKTAFEKGKSIWIEPTWYTRIKEICEKDPNHNHVLFIDEITNVHANEQSLVFHIVLEHSIDGNMGKLPKNCVVVAAGNNPEESAAAYNMPEPLFRRFDAHIELQPDIKSFLEWGSELNGKGHPKIHPLVAAFIAANGEKTFYSKYDEEKPPKFAIDPRGWEQVSNIIYDNNNVLRLKLIADKIGLDNASALLRFASIERITVEDIMLDCYAHADIPRNQDEKYALVCSLRRASEHEVKKVREFIKENLGSELLSYFDSIWIEGNDERAILIDQLDNPVSVNDRESGI